MCCQYFISIRHFTVKLGGLHMLMVEHFTDDVNILTLGHQLGSVCMTKAVKSNFLSNAGDLAPGP